MANDSDAFDDYGRKRGIFTERDRRFLAGELDEELSDNERRQKRYRLRERMENALQDLAYLRLMSLGDVGQLGDQFEEGVGFVRPTGEKRDPQTDKFWLLIDGAFEVALFAGGLVGHGPFYNRLEQLVAKQAAIDYYEQTGEFGVYDGDFSVKHTDEMSISELEELFATAKSLSELDELPPGTAEVLGLSPPPTAPEDAPRHAELIGVVETAIDDLTDESPVANRQAVLGRVVDKAGVARDTAREAYADALHAEVCSEPYPEKTVLVPDE